MNLQYPLKGIGTTPGIYLTQKFGEHPEIYSQFNLKGHNGLDWACPNGTPVLAPCDGDVGYETETQNFGKGYGMNARLFTPYTENGATRMELIFGHLKKYGTPGQVKQGDIIGWSDNTGFSTGPHLHFGIRLWNDSGIINYGNGYLGWIDPTPFLVKEIMEILQVVGESTLVVKNLDGKYYQIATAPELYPYVAKTLGLEGKVFGAITRAEVDANLGGVLTAGLSFISK